MQGHLNVKYTLAVEMVDIWHNISRYKYSETYKTGTLVAYDIHYRLYKSDIYKNVTTTSSPLPLVSIVLD